MPRAGLAIVLPAFNEAMTIEATLLAFHAVAPEAHFVVVDNNSTDATGDVARRTLAALGARGTVIAENRQGKGFAVRAGLQAVDADLYVLCDADMTYPAESVRALCAPVAEGHADMVVGDRHVLGHYSQKISPPLHGFGNRLVIRLINRLFDARLGDILSGYRALSREFVANFPILSRGFEVEAEMTLHALDKRFRVVEVPITYQDRPEGSESKLNTIRDGGRVLTTILQILRYYRPLYLFGILAGMFSALGILIGAVPVYQFATTGLVLSVPAAVLAASLEVIGLVFGAIGLVSDALVRQHRFDFELSLIRRRWDSGRIPE